MTTTGMPMRGKRTMNVALKKKRRVNHLRARREDDRVHSRVEHRQQADGGSVRRVVESGLGGSELLPRRSSRTKSSKHLPRPNGLQKLETGSDESEVEDEEEGRGEDRSVSDRLTD